MDHLFRTTVLTGATSGIGEALAHRLASLTDRLIVQGPEPSEPDALAGIRAAGDADVHYVSCDFTLLRNVDEGAATIRDLAPEIDLLINNAGVPGAPRRRLTADGNERTLQVNALAPALLTTLLRPCLHAGARIVNVGSAAHRFQQFHFDDLDITHGYSPTVAYGRAKLAMVTWSLMLADLLRPASIKVVTVCPGLNDTPLSAAMMGHIGGSPIVGAARVLHAATADLPTGTYLENDEPTPASGEARDAGNRERLAEDFARRRPALLA